MKVLVTGATGLIGRRVVARLRQAGFDVRIASRRPEKLAAVGEVLPLPGPNAPDAAFLALMRDVSHVVHCAALNNDRRASDADYQAANATLTGRLAKAAAACAGGRFVYLSSIRAVAGPGFSGTIDEATPPAPQCAYGRSKRDGEIRMIEAYAGRPDATALRLPPVYGEGMRGNMDALMRLADTALPLPAGTLGGLRSLISSDAAAGAVLHLLSRPGPLHPAYVAGNAAPLALSEIIAAFRRGFGRPPRLLPVPALPLRLAATLLGRQASLQALTAAQICDASLLTSEGWIPETDTLGRLEDLARKKAYQAR
ncbi:NAD-dependent epimerase/dehydratase family protein [Mesorhizobium tamadayense]|uniref:NAD-dependent epimerase/dehydratase family protein n=1 Tax=Mesorhizobium tamadayense TaxID=425306 RepID=A0A3P3FAW4_9HYPH|nr:NAD-dependent epimerase/dehydratase family protein [Mesorhizobium tamadayense]RRH95456.1 NAD-dependent epimerase/dehydratase family protein [Mesorhizobium tamadayense]